MFDQLEYLKQSSEMRPEFILIDCIEYVIERAAVFLKTLLSLIDVLDISYFHTQGSPKNSHRALEVMSRFFAITL
ncbi:hypothetical protein ASE52_01465 [Acidovorax sp. Root275]|nr:hypothetical protein ASE52_01465 [Acidovorax sp. Root275]